MADQSHRTDRRPATCIALVALIAALGCEGEDFVRGEPSEELSRPATHPVMIRQPATLTSIATGATDQLGRPTSIACATCHGNRETEHELPPDAASIGGPHAELELVHGELTCGSCHHPEQYDQLRLADGTAMPLGDAMRLCGQCHGTQKRDYDHGSHGGMRGHWDLSAGPRERNHCVDCHDPHAPAYPSFEPVFPPRDRFLGHEHDDEGADAGGDHG